MRGRDGPVPIRGPRQKGRGRCGDGLFGSQTLVIVLVLDVREELGSAKRGRQKDDHGGDRLKYLTKFIVPRKAFGLKDLERYKR